MRYVSIALTALVLTCSHAAYALEGTVIDGNTGKPLAGVYVIGAWHVSGGLVIASSSCAKLDLTVTDARGQFTLPGSTGRLLSRILASETLNVYYYKSGYREDRARSAPAGHAALVPRNGSTWDRFTDIGNVMTHADCGDDPASVSNRVRLFNAMYQEASSIAVTPKERAAAARILYAIEAAELGEEEALRKLEMRERSEWQKP